MADENADAAEAVVPVAVGDVELPRVAGQPRQEVPHAAHLVLLGADRGGTNS